LVQAHAEELPFPDGVFDWVTGCEVVEHLGNPSRFIREAWRVLNSTDHLLLTTPNRLQYFRPWRPRLFWLALRRRVVLDLSHVREFSAAELEQLVAPVFRPVQTRFVGTLWGWPRTIRIEKLPRAFQRLWAQGIYMTAAKLP
jgi:ubiquinone/menaquinone biosynthesis C-methylase UbiE